jgi:hypothetical protein
MWVNRIFVVQFVKKIESELRQKLSSASCSPSFSACLVKISQLPHVERSSYACFNTKIFVSDRCLKKAIKSQLKRARVIYWMIDLNLLSRVGRLRSRSTSGNNLKKHWKIRLSFVKLRKKSFIGFSALDHEIPRALSTPGITRRDVRNRLI